MLLAAAAVLLLALPGHAVEEVKSPQWFTDNVLTPDDRITLVVFHDSTQAKSTAFMRDVVPKAAAELDGLVDVVTLDVSDPTLGWIGHAYHVRYHPGLLLFPASAPSAASPGKDMLARPGGLKAPIAYDMPPLPEHIKNWCVSKLPEPRPPKIQVRKAANVGDVKSAVVVSTNKDKISPLVKALVVRLGGRIDFVIAKGADKSSIAVHDAEGKRHEFKGKVGARALLDFIEPFVTVDRTKRLEEAKQQEALDFDMLKRKAASPVFKVTSSGEWEHEVMRPKLVLVAFLDPTADGHDGYLDALVKVAKRERTAVQNVVWVEAAIASALMQHFGVEAGGAVFVSPKHGKWTRFTGALSEDGLNRFIDGPLLRGQGARNLGKLPAFP